MFNDHPACSPEKHFANPIRPFDDIYDAPISRGFDEHIWIVPPIDIEDYGGHIVID